ncbi:MAG: NlpC/P60 family protein [Candidatus Bathyarchaeia archaeon]
MYWDVRAVRALLMGQLMAICREYYRVVSKVTLLSLLLLGIIPSGQTQRLYIVAPQGDLYDRLHTVDHQYTYDTYTFGLVYYYWLIPFQYVSDSGWVAGTWYPLNVIPTGQRPFIWSPKVSEEVVLTPQFPLSGCQWGDTVRLDSSNRYLFFWTKQNWWDYDGIADPYILAYYSIYNKKFEFYRESVEPYSAWATNYPIFHSRWSLFLLGDGTITLYRYEGHQGYGWRHFDRYPAIWFPPGSPPRWSQQGSSGITLPSNRDEDYLVRFTEDGTMLFGARESYQNYYYIRKSIGSQNWEEIRATGWAIPMASSADNRYTLHNVRITMDRGIATLVDWRTRQVTIITPPSVSGLEPFFWTASGMSADGSHVVGCLYSVYDRNTGRIVDVGRAFVWERGKGAQFIDSKYEAVIPYGYGNERWKVKKAIGISPNDRYILLEMLRPINTSRGLDYELVYGLLDTSKAKLSPESIFVVYRNLTDPNRAYPYEGDDIELRVFVKSDDRYYTQADEYNITDLSKFLAKYRWLHTGTKTRRYGGEQIDLDPKGTPYRGMTTVLPWVYAKAEVRWFMAYPIRYGSGPHYTKYPSYTEVTEARNQWVWRPFALPAGTHRIFVRVHWPDRRADDWINAKLYQPTPGIWRAMGNDKALADWTLLWSQNCDEEDELALRVSVRVRASWITHPQRRALVEWASSFLNVPYEWGGSWYGGRADDQAHTINAGYGIDCSGLVCAAAWMAGYNIPRINTEMMLRNAYTSAVSAANLEPGDLIVMRRIDENRPGHVWIVSRIVRRSQQAEGGWKIEVQLIQASGGANKVISGSYWFIVQNLQSDQVDTEASLEGLDLSGRYADAIIRLRRLR